MEKQTYQLPADKNLEIIKTQLESRQEFQSLLKRFEGEGFEFIFSRSKAFMTFDNTVENNPNPSLFCIIPSLVPLDLDRDENHTAIGIIAFINNDRYAFLATEVLVNHKPFVISNYKLHYLTKENEVDLMFEVNRDELEQYDIKELSERIKDIGLKEENNINAGIVPEDFNFIIYNSLSEFLNDKYTEGYPRNYKESMLLETSLVEKFSLAIATKTQTSAIKASWCCSCTCCNGCTTTSTSFTLSLSTVAEIEK